ncbi:YfdQ family protein [Laribacter hongkongensis]|uniref:DUF2303 family protein n=1 Tax=Laribacter hongkongensis TaxID=168471 RepID=UPI001EFE16D9|nr:DUF2303 family protein [Laribacter hongkongensis]MCG8991789.1 YfdQ family protein [Laribacter hongkongensis]MCG8998714.1 YfdQ family protein [Laribacter hongkongensis]MCG9000212.1 YfdQ family protein [Laribacter hongkongensis]MCG9004431.1 YfdQ family protein [Laribacter hongkongensis]MCG9006602.1 YfdQ family protein [Laribacter hongkongensis]
MPQENQSQFSTGNTSLPNNIQTILDAAAKPYIESISIDGLQAGSIPVLMIPEGYKAEVLKDLQIHIEKHLPVPLRKRGGVVLHDANSFVNYINTHKIDGITSIYCDADYQQSKVDLIAIFNDNGTNQTGWRDHTAAYSPIQSVEWARWTKKNRSTFTQVEFALFIEDNLQDIASVEGMPTGTQMLEMAMNLEANQDSRFKSNIRLQSGGTELAFVQKEDDATLEKMRLFERFSIGIPPFFNGSSFRIDARLRYRVRDGKLTFWFELIREDKVLQAAAEEEISKIAEATTLTVLHGNPRLNSSSHH